MSEVATTRLRVAVLSRRFARHLGGAENYAVSLVEELASRHDITVRHPPHGDRSLAAHSRFAAP